MTQIISLTTNSLLKQFKDDNEYLIDFDSYSEIENNKRGTYEDSLAENEQILREHMPNKILFSIEESAALLGISYDYVRSLTTNGKIASKQFGKRKMIHIKELSRLITEGVE